jgi:hypothetical protein
MMFRWSGAKDQVDLPVNEVGVGDLVYADIRDLDLYGWGIVSTTREYGGKVTLFLEVADVDFGGGLTAPMLFSPSWTLPSQTVVRVRRYRSDWYRRRAIKKMEAWAVSRPQRNEKYLNSLRKRAQRQRTT